MAWRRALFDKRRTTQRDAADMTDIIVNRRMDGREWLALVVLSAFWAHRSCLPAFR